MGSDVVLTQQQPSSVAMPLMSVTVEDMEKFNQKDVQLIQNLFDWREQSSRDTWILGKPISY